MPKILGIDRARFTKNYIINGDMKISQRGTSFAAIADGAYALDRYRYFKNGAMVHTVSQDLDVPTLADVLANTGTAYLYQNSIRLNLTTPDTSIASTEYCFFGQRIEGYNFANIAQKAFSISFWVKAALSGTYSVALHNAGADRYFIKEYTINSANTWEYKTINVPASPSAGTWSYGNGIGISVYFVLAMGSNFNSGTANSWQSGGQYATTNQVNGVNTGATDFRMTGLMINEGVVSAPFTLFGGDIEEELQACQRYYWRSFISSAGRAFPANGFAQTTTRAVFNFLHPVSMRIVPSGIDTTGMASNYAVYRANSAHLTASSVPTYELDSTTENSVVAVTVAAGLTALEGCILGNNVINTYVGINAEL